MNWIKSNILWISLGLYAVFATGIITMFNGTGDSGDSVLHFLFAQSAPNHPELYLNHWAKPVFTLLASPFAQFGFVGMKVFNALTVLLTLFFTYRAAEKWKLNRPVLVIVFIVCAPLLIRHTFSGLTEPLFAMFIAWGVYLVARNKWLLVCIVVSFLPFVRSEGLIVMTAFGLLLLVQKQWKYIPWLLFGHVAYSLVGWFHYKDILWVFTKIPYASARSIYGKGDLLHFVDQLPFVIGVPAVLFLAVGIGRLLHQLFRKQFHTELHTLVLYGFLSYFVAHSLFWYLGIFNSMGLNRVLLGVMPFMAILCLVGFNTLVDLLPNMIVRRVIFTVLTIILLSFPVWDNPSAVHWKRDMNLSGEQKVARKATLYAKSLNSEGRYLYLPPYVSMELNIDHFDTKRRTDINPATIQVATSGDVLIWDNWFSVVDAHVTQKMIEESGAFQKLRTVKGMQEDRQVIYIVYQAK
ncbi:MAG: hypothetical protein NXI10_00900 [bacterium]|nr:hypothetical protein [bacterium]